MGLHACPENKYSSLTNHCKIEATVVLKDEAICPSDPFQCAAELALECMGRTEPFLLLQQDGGSDYNPTSPRGIAALLMIAIGLGLEHVIAIKNAGGCSIYNRIERLMSSINLCCVGLALAREQSSDEVKEGIKRSKSVKDFIDKNRNNSKVMNEHAQSTQPAINKINEAISQGEYAGKRIKIGRIAKKEYLDELMNELKSILLFLPDNLFTCPSQDIFGSDEGKEFFSKYVRLGRCMLEIFRRRDDCKCFFCTAPSKSNERCKGHAPYPVRSNKDEFSKFSAPAPLGSESIETDCPSLKEHKHNGIFFVQLNKLSKSAVLGFIACALCEKIRALHGSRKNVPEEFITWLIETYAPAFEFQCGQPLFPTNDIDKVELPCEE